MEPGSLGLSHVLMSISGSEKARLVWDLGTHGPVLRMRPFSWEERQTSPFSVSVL